MASGFPDFRRALEVLVDEKVEFLLVGGVAAVAHGVPVSTFDVDIVHRRTADNVERLCRALDRIEARYLRPEGEGPRLPLPDLLLGPGHRLFETNFGGLDVCRVLYGDEDFESLRAQSLSISLAGRQIAILTLEKLVELKRRSSAEKDLAALPVYEATLRARRGSAGREGPSKG